MAILSVFERWVRFLGGLAAGGALAVIFYGLWRGLQRPVGRTSGHPPSFLRQPVFYLLAAIGYFGILYLLWRPLPVSLSVQARLLALLLGALLYFPGLGLIVWGRLALGKYYFVSSSLGAQLSQSHRLITHGPYAIMRHPMYTGILLVGLGGILFYRTWAFVFFALNFLGMIVRARREEEALREEFGDQWLEYCRRVPRWFPLYVGGRNDRKD